MACRATIHVKVHRQIVQSIPLDDADVECLIQGLRLVTPCTQRIGRLIDLLEQIRNRDQSATRTSRVSVAQIGRQCQVRPPVVTAGSLLPPREDSGCADATGSTLTLLPIAADGARRSWRSPEGRDRWPRVEHPLEAKAAGGAAGPTRRQYLSGKPHRWQKPITPPALRMHSAYNLPHCLSKH
jgi:hypothetical protein